MQSHVFYSKMYTNFAFAKNKGMKKSTKVFLVLFVATFIPAIVLGKFVLAGITPTEKGFSFNFDGRGIAGIVLIITSSVLGFILYRRFIMSRPMHYAIFFSSLPLLIFYGVSLFLLVESASYNNQTASSVRGLLNLSTDNAYNTILWAILLTLIFIGLMFLNFYLLCKPLGRVEKIVARLGDGRVKESKLKIGGSKQFSNIEHSLNKINSNYRSNENDIKQANIEAQKFVPKQFIRFLGKTSIAELELGHQVKKNATLMSVKLVGLNNSDRMSLEENFNFLNSYLNVVSPVVRRFGGFIDKYFGEGILAVFGRAENAIDCSHAIVRAVNIKNRQNKSLPNVDIRICTISSQVIFGIVGEQERKLPTIISPVTAELEKLDSICKLMGAKVLLSGRCMELLPLNYKFSYRHIGSVTFTEKEKTLLFEDLEVLPRDRSAPILKAKRVFEQGVLCYENGDYHKACDCFSDALRIAPDDKGCYVYFNKAKEKLDR